MKQGQYEFRLEAYHKTMSDLIEYREGATFLAGFGEHQDWQDKVETGRGWSYGVEAFVQKETRPHHRLDRVHPFLDETPLLPTE